mmetsp:Transcript_23287/g.32620  ORF Transcript_23287/g.32620 Transcript_23287/m.32620 type:complete len:403 (-) Transcript_23287:178-1386(-)
MKEKLQNAGAAVKARLQNSWRTIATFYAGLSTKASWSIVAGSALVVFALPFVLPDLGGISDVKVAFLGNAILASNDLPRFMEALGQHSHIQQDSCLHGSASITSIFTTGNGMYGKWTTATAQTLEENYWGAEYDYGSCTPTQMLYGYDADLSAYNQDGTYYDDGRNPCFQDTDGTMYLNYLNDMIGVRGDFDYLVIADQTKRIAIPQSRNQSMETLKTVVLPMLLETNVTPIIMETHSFWSAYTNMTNLDDVPTFQSMIHAGCQDYADVLKEGLPRSQKPKIAPVGLAFLTIWEEDEDMWFKLFQNDDIHTSIWGSYLYGLVLYATIYHKMPPRSVAIPSNMADLWSKARRLDDAAQDDTIEYPDKDDAIYLYRIADRVAKKGYIPKTLIKNYQPEEDWLYG